MRDRPPTPPCRALNAALTEASANAPRSAISSAILARRCFELRVRHDLVDQADVQRFARVSFGLRYHISLARFLPTRSSRYQVP